MTHEELIAALETAPTGTRELGVVVLEAVGWRLKQARILDAAGDVDTAEWWEDASGRRQALQYGSEARVVTDLNFRLPGVPEGRWCVDVCHDFVEACLFPDGTTECFAGNARTEALARCIVQLKAVLATK